MTPAIAVLFLCAVGTVQHQRHRGSGLGALLIRRDGGLLQVLRVQLEPLKIGHREVAVPDQRRTACWKLFLFLDKPFEICCLCWEVNA